MKKFFPYLVAVLLACSFTLPASGQNTPVKNLAPTGDLGPLMSAIESARLFPVFIIPLGTGYYDFELKASVDNFTANDMVYFFASAVDVNPGMPMWDTSPKIFFTLSTPDPRVWHTANPAASIYSQAGATTNARINQVMVIPSKLTGSTSWMYKGNTHLVWSYTRINTVGPETDGSGHAVWTPIVPVEWRTSPLTP